MLQEKEYRNSNRLRSCSRSYLLRNPEIRFKQKFTTEDLARHNRNQKIHLNHEKHEKARKRQIQSHHEEHEESEGKPGSAALRSGILDFAVPATNASPLDHARRAAGGE